METAGSVALLAADVPLGDGLRPDVVVHGVTTVAQRPGWTLHLVSRVVLGPPVRAGLHVVPPPRPVPHVPLSREDEIIVTALCKVALFPFAAVHKSDIR